MFYIKLNDDMELVITVREAIHRGDHLTKSSPSLCLCKLAISIPPLPLCI